MNKFKKVLSLSVLSMAALSMATGACFLIQPTSISKSNADVVEETIANVIPPYINKGAMTQNNTYFSKELPLSFNTESTNGRGSVTTSSDAASTSTSKQVYAYFPNKTEDPNHYYLFNDIQISVYINGEQIPVDSSNYILTSNDYIRNGDAEVYPQTLQMKIKRNIAYGETKAKPAKDATEDTEGVPIKPGVLSINKSGLLEVNISYGLYDTTFVPGKNYNPEDINNSSDFTETTTYTNQTFSFTAFLFNNDDYFEPSCQDAPKITYSSLARNASLSSSTHKWEYFYNYETQDLPSITYDANHFRLTLTKNFNNNTQSATLTFNPETNEIVKPDFVQDVVVAENGNKTTVYFNDVGVYNMHYDMIYNYSTTAGEIVTYHTYEINQPLNLDFNDQGDIVKVLDQKVHVVGSQASYTDYTDNEFKEFKKIVKNEDGKYTVEKGADVSYLSTNESTTADDIANYLLDNNIAPVSTNQTPIKFTNNFSPTSPKIESRKLANDEKSWEAPKDFSITSNLSEPGTYLISLTNISYASHPDSGKTFRQFFYFKIDKTTPSVNITAGDKELFSREYTNAAEVKISYSSAQSDFDAPVKFELIRKDFTTGTTHPAVSILTDSTEETITEEGTYTLNIYYGKQSLALTPITRTFTIDRQAISALTPYAVETSGINADYRTTSAFANATNQPFVFTWDNVKKSGARTYGYYKYFPLTYTNYYNTSDINSLIGNLLRNEMLAADRELTISAGNSWINYANAQHLTLNNSSIPSNYVKESAGLYMFEIFDDAGNSAVYLVFLDDSKPYFVLYTQSEGYQLITSNYTLTTDATVIWSKNKAIKTNYNESNLAQICTNRNGKEDTSLQDALNAFINENIKYYDIGSVKKGLYYLSPIDAEMAYKDKSSEKYTLETMSQKDIQFSYTIHYTINAGQAKYYLSTSNASQYLTMVAGESGERELVDATQSSGVTYIDGNILYSADVYMLATETGYKYYYGQSGSLSLTSLEGESVTATITNGVCYINGKAASKMPFVDMEGTYVFLIRDASNTKGANLSQDQKFLRYASSFQYIKVTSDSSQMQVYYKEDSNLQTTLTDASFARIDEILEDGNSTGYNKKSSYFNPTSVNKVLYVSFQPTIGNAGSSTITQVDKVTLSFYPYETKVVTKLDANKTPYFAFYKTLATNPLFENVIYDLSIDGANESVVEKEINIDKEITVAGKYVLTRTYKTGEGYTIDIFDYFERKLTAIVDRYGVITAPETISAESFIKQYTIGAETNDAFFTAQTYGNIVIVTPINGSDGDINDANCEVYDGEENQIVEIFGVGDQVYVIFENNVSKDFELRISSATVGENLTPKPFDDGTKVKTVTIGPSLESIVGGDILINMYDDKNLPEGVIAVSFPYYNNGINSGDSLYTANNNNWSDNDTSVTTSLKTNKLPVKLYIPEVKYTISNEDDIDEDEQVFIKNVLNGDLTYFDNDENFRQTSIITPYQIVASIEFLATGASETEVYTSTAGENGFLAFTDSNGAVVKNFSKAGSYIVTITQGYYSDSNSTNNFRKNYKFAFTIESSTPEFNISASGKELNTLDQASYYTNEKSATISWEEDTDDRYIAKIDKTKIEVTITKSQNQFFDNISISPLEDGSYEITTQDTLLKNAIEFSKSGKMNYLSINFDKLGLYNNDDKLSITMQFEGHNDAYYQKTTKTIVIDKKASYETVGSLIGKLSAFTNDAIPLDESNLRNYYNIEGKSVETPDEAAYNISKNVGYLKYYAYQVSDDFFTALKTMVETNNTLGANYRGDTIAAYYRLLTEDPYSGTFTETSYDNFAASNYSEIVNGTPTEYGYFEIVEQDLAGNLTIYLVHKYTTASDMTDIIDDQGNETQEFSQGLHYTDGRTDKYAFDKQILTNLLNIYSSTSFSVEKLNFMGDRWLELNINGSLYMLNPWLENGQAYRLAGQNAEIVSLNAIFASFSSSTTPINIAISNGADGSFANIKLTLLDGASLNTYLSDSTAQEYISIGYSNSVYPVKVTVYNGNQVYSAQNDPNTLENLNSSYAYLADWSKYDNSTIAATADQTLSRLNFTFVTLPNPNSKIKYEIVDNFGNTTKIVHVYGQNLYNEIESSGNMYTALINDATTDHEAQTYYISPVDLRFSYNDTVHALKVFKWDGNVWAPTTEYGYSRVNLTTMTFSNTSGGLVNNKYKIDVYEYDEDSPTNVDDSKYVKTVYFHIYNMLPQTDETLESYFKLSDNYGENITDTTLTDTTVQRITINNRVYTISRSGSTFASSVTFTYSNSESFDYPFTAYYYKEGGESSGWTVVKSGTSFTESGVYYFLISYDSVLTNEYSLYKLEILDSATEFYRVTNNGKQVEKAGSYYYYRGTEYSEYYIVNVNYNTSASLVQIVPNNYQNVKVQPTSIKEAEGEGVFTIGYRVYNYSESEAAKPGTSPFDRTVFITFIPPTSQPVSEAYFTFNSADQIDMLTSSSITAAADKNDSALSSVKLIFSNSYGIANNLIRISILKDGVAYPIETKTEEIVSSESGKANKTYRYVELTTSGTYTISLSDIAGNKQVFAAGTSQASGTLKLIFLKDVAFTMTYTDTDGVTHTTDPIQKGVFNRKVELTLLKTEEYYTAQSVGSGQSMITATRNGIEYTDFGFDATTKTFTFEKPGYYSVYFSATSTTGVPIREEVYNFTIVNPEESRYSFEYAPFDGYYIKSIVKDNLGDITRDENGQLKQSFKDVYQTVIINNKEYLKHFTTSFLDSLTGVGRYTVTICTTKALNRTDYTDTTDFSFSYWVNTSTVPISVSVTEGEATSKNIDVSFNAERVFEAVGECVITIGSQQFEINADTIATLGTVTQPITTTGTYFITVKSTSGNLLYSYKVIKNEPLNAWAIAAICIGAVGAIIVVVVIIKLRKKIKVK